MTESDLIDLKNLGATSVNWLRAIGVHTRQDLADLGPVEAYNRIRKRGFKVSKVLLYAIQGALINAHWNELDPSLKESLVQEADRSLEMSEPV